MYYVYWYDKIMNHELINKIAQDIAICHANILEHEIKSVCERFNVQPTDLVINYLPDNVVEILLKCSTFKLDIQYIT